MCAKVHNQVCQQECRQIAQLSSASVPSLQVMTAQMQQMSLSSSSSGDSGGCGASSSLGSSGDSRGTAGEQQQQQEDGQQQQQDVFSGPIEDQLKRVTERYLQETILLHVVTLNILTQLQRSLLYLHSYPYSYTPNTLVNAVRQLYNERESLGDAAWEVGPQTGKYWKLLALQRQQQQQQQMPQQQQQQWQWPKQERDSCADWSEGFDGESAKMLQQIEEEDRQLQQQGMGQWVWLYDDLQVDIYGQSCYNICYNTCCCSRLLRKIGGCSSRGWGSGCGRMTTCRLTSRVKVVITSVITHAAAD
jgi:hypothetical protein